MPTVKQRGFAIWLIMLPVLAASLFVLYTVIMFNWSYSEGERAGYVQKFSKKGWACKTWEGELAMVTMPGTLTEKFYFTVRNDAIAQKINQHLGKKVSLIYEEHVGLPSTCFGDTAYFVSGVRLVE